MAGTKKRTKTALVSLICALSVGMTSTHANADGPACPAVPGAFYTTEIDGWVECWATFVEESGSVYVPDSAWESIASVEFGFIATPVPTTETVLKQAELGGIYERPHMTCDGCLGQRSLRTKHKWSWEYVGYRSGNWADELIDQMHVHAVLIHNSSNNDCATSAKYEGGQYYAGNNTSYYIKELTLPDSPQKKGFNDRWTVSGGQRWHDDGGLWVLDERWDVCKQYS